jgi:hypothetical protein
MLPGDALLHLEAWLLCHAKDSKDVKVESNLNGCPRTAGESKIEDTRVWCNTLLLCVMLSLPYTYRHLDMMAMISSANEGLENEDHDGLVE